MIDLGSSVLVRSAIVEQEGARWRAIARAGTVGDACLTIGAANAPASRAGPVAAERAVGQGEQSVVTPNRSAEVHRLVSPKMAPRETEIGAVFADQSPPHVALLF